MQPHEERVGEERRELGVRLVKLASLIAMSPVFMTLDSVDQNLLREQRNAMMAYHDALSARIDRFYA